VPLDHFQYKRAMLFSGHKQIEPRPGLNWSPFSQAEESGPFEFSKIRGKMGLLIGLKTGSLLFQPITPS
jgi:hypothetical protein